MTLQPPPGFADGGIALDPALVRVVRTDGALSGVSPDSLRCCGRPAGLIVAFLSPNVDFSATCEALRDMSAGAPFLAVSTAGILCEVPGAVAPLYEATDPGWQTVLVQVFSPDLIERVSLHSVPLHNEDIRYGAPKLTRRERIQRIAESLDAIRVPFHIDSNDTLALTFVDGMSACESYFMEAVYRVGRFPCLFIGGSAGGNFDSGKTYTFDGRSTSENHAVVAFVKLAQGKRYAVLKTQNFRKTDKQFIVLDADPDRRTVSSVVDPETFAVHPIIDHVCGLLGCARAELESHLVKQTFGIEVAGELFVRSIARIDLENDEISFFCDVSTGDRLLLLESTDFVTQTRDDYQTFLRGKPQPVAGLLNDCILRRLNNQQDIAAIEQFWGCPVAGFSTFGELFGININQTLTAIFFFDVAQGQAFSDVFLDYFPAHYGNFQNYFTLVRLARVELLVEIRARAANQLTDHFANMANLSEEMEAMAVHARQERAQRELRGQLQAITASLHEGVLLVDAEGRIIFANPSAEHLLEQPTLPLLALDDVMKLIVHDEAVPFEQGPFRTVIESGASNSADDCFITIAGGRRLNVAYTACALEDGGAVVISFRSIETLKEAQRQALQSSHLASIGQLAAGIAHEINTPIQYVGDNLHFIIDSFNDIAATLSALRRDQATAGPNEAIEMMCAEKAIDDLLEEIPLAATQSLDGIKHVAHIVKSMKEFSHPGSGVKTPVDINSHIKTTVTISRNEWKEVAAVETDLAGDLPLIPCFPTDINQLLLNLVVNAAQAIGAQKRASPGHIHITTRRLAGHVEIRISDDGPGVPEKVRGRIFDPFFTTKEVGKGTGQGLAIARDVVESKHGGTIALDLSVSQGACFVVRLPIADTAP